MLPFANLSGDPEQEYFADGMVEEIITALSRFKSIFVIASGSSLSFKGKAVSPQEAATAAGRALRAGRQRPQGGRPRPHRREADRRRRRSRRSGAERFEDTLEDVFALQDKVALAVAGKIEPTIQEADIRRANARPTENMGSYELYLRAVALSRTRRKADALEELELLDRAVALDSQYGAALSLAAFCHMLIVLYGWSDDPETHRDQGIELVRRAQKAPGDDAETLARLAAAISGLERDNAAAVVLIDRALALNPGSAYVWLTSGNLQLILGDPDVAVEHVETSIRLDPLSPDRWLQLGFLGRARFHQGRYAEAVAPLKEASQLSDAPFLLPYLAATYGYLGQAGAAREVLARYRALSPQPIAIMVGAVVLNQVLEGIALAGEEPANGPADA